MGHEGRIAGMPYVQLDLPVAVPAAQRIPLAAAIGETYAETMQTEADRVSVAFRELGPDGVLRCHAEGPGRAIVVHADIRRGRPAEQRQRLARALSALLAEQVQVPDVVVYFTEHDAQDIFRDGAWTTEWKAPSREQKSRSEPRDSP